MAVGAMIFPFLLYLLLLLPSLLHHHLLLLRNDQLVYDLAYRMMLLYGVLCRLLLLHSNFGLLRLLLLRLFGLEVVRKGMEV
jgi:hypothetical protein